MISAPPLTVDQGLEYAIGELHDSKTMIMDVGRTITELSYFVGRQWSSEATAAKLGSLQDQLTRVANALGRAAHRIDETRDIARQSSNNKRTE